MSDSIFDRLFELFQTPGPVNWKLAAEVRKSLAGTPMPVEPALAEEYRELTLAAQLRMAAATHLDLTAPRDLQPVDAATWAEENEQSFRFALEPLAGKLNVQPEVPEQMAGNPLAAMMASLGPAVLGMQAGTMVGLLSHRVLGQFDAGLPTLDHDDLYLVVPNVEAFATEHGLDARQVRMWAAAHEVVHHAILNLPWVRGRVVDAMEHYYAGVEFDPSRLTDALGAMDQPDQIEDMLGGANSLGALLGAETDPERLAPLQALVGAIEGYGDYVVHRSLDGVVPDLVRIEEAIGRRRIEPTSGEDFLGQLAGIELNRRHGRDAAALFTEIERRWGDGAVATAWAEPDHLPTLPELTDPVGWAARVLLDDSL